MTVAVEVEISEDFLICLTALKTINCEMDNATVTPVSSTPQ